MKFRTQSNATGPPADVGTCRHRSADVTWRRHGLFYFCNKIYSRVSQNGSFFLVIFFITYSGSERAGSPSESIWQPPHMDTRNLRRVTKCVTSLLGGNRTSKRKGIRMMEVKRGVGYRNSHSLDDK
ncbi:hypothetical protein EVAR_21972_1 [Eumeta japonica]|uniref:Uncharacterized protein n=1 Tax=Eumeta variegata TaxID=151549 RepID=A0A4C1VXZ1_EUMVA|nr:hypothetical protein EVAR_21972_1 [Eumeta japonica]